MNIQKWGNESFQKETIVRRHPCPTEQERVSFPAEQHCRKGLFITLAFWDNAFSDNVIYEKLLSDKLSVDLGYVYENIVAQMLVASGHKLFYHTWRSETSNHNYEVDFLLSKGTKIRPIEVKSSGYKTHKSLDEFCRKYSGNVSDRYLLYTKDLRRDKQTLLLPVMLTMFL